MPPLTWEELPLAALDLLHSSVMPGTDLTKAGTSYQNNAAAQAPGEPEVAHSQLAFPGSLHGHLLLHGYNLPEPGLFLQTRRLSSPK